VPTTAVERPAAVHVPLPLATAPRATTTLGRMLLHVPWQAWVALDWLVVLLATQAAYHALIFGNPALNWVVGPWPSVLAFCTCLTVAGLIFGLYERQTLLARSRIIVRTALTLALGSVLAYAVIYVGLYATSSRWIGLWIVVVHLLTATPLRLLAYHVIDRSRLNVVCVGTTHSVRRLMSLLCNGHRGHYHVVGHVLVPRAEDAPRPESRFVPMTGVESDRVLRHLCPCVGAIDEIDTVIARHRIDHVVVDPNVAGLPTVDEAIQRCLEQGCRVSDQPTFTEKLLGEVPAEAIDTQWFLLADVATDGGYDAVKRLYDVAAALVGLTVTLPLWPLIALAIRLDSPGPVFYRQRRVGRHGRCFTIYKFRTMRTDAEAGGVQWAAAGDPRVTRLGRFLRKSRLDEFPQFWNILRGDMSLVGPRPERPEFVEQLARQIPHYRQRHLIKPGLTGWAQINYRYGASVADAHRKLCYDLYYLKHRSVDLDGAIIIRTIGTFLLGSR